MHTVSKEQNLPNFHYKLCLCIQLSLASSEVPSGLDKGVKEAEDARRAVKRLGDRNETLYHDIQDQTRDLVSLVQETGKLTKELHELERLSKYLSCLVHIQTLR